MSNSACFYCDLSGTQSNNKFLIKRSQLSWPASGTKYQIRSNGEGLWLLLASRLFRLQNEKLFDVQIDQLNDFHMKIILAFHA